MSAKDFWTGRFEISTSIDSAGFMKTVYTLSMNTIYLSTQVASGTVFRKHTAVEKKITNLSYIVKDIGKHF